MTREFLVGIRSTLVLWLLTALIYPLILLGVGQLAFPYQANGSLLADDRGQVVGSALIGQSFTSDRYFLSRPSTTSYSEGEDAQPTGISGASNLAPSNPDLISRVEETIVSLQQAGIEPTADLVYTSGSSLDPHISPDAARSQITKVAQARSVTPEELEQLIAQHTDGRFLGIFGEPGVNVLQLNRSLDTEL